MLRVTASDTQTWLADTDPLPVVPLDDPVAPVAFTQDVYTHAIPQMEEAAAQQIADLVLGGDGSSAD